MFHRGLILVLLDPQNQAQRTVEDCSSRDEVWYVLEADHHFDTSLHVVVTRATEKHHTSHEARLPNLDGSLRTMLLERRLRRCLCRIIARIVSSDMPACRLNGVVPLTLYLFAALVASTEDLTECDSWYECSGVLMFLI